MRNDLVLVDREILLTELRQVFDTDTANTLLGVLDKVVAQVRAASPTREDFSELRRIIVELAESHQRAEARLSRLEESVAALIEAQQRAEARLSRLEEAVTALVEAQQRTEIQVAGLAASQQWLVDKLAKVDERTLEQAYREKAVAYFGRLLRRPQVVSLASLWDVLETQLTPDELDETLLLDLVVRGQPRMGEGREDVWLAVEVSAVVDVEDVTRAGRRAELLRRAGYRAIPVAAGESATLGAEAEARAQNVVILQDGRSFLWDEALAAWTV